jgi:urease accessory protein
MFDAAEMPMLQRVRGEARLGMTAAPAGGAPRLTELVQQGSAKLFLPRVHAARPEAVFLNTAGGLTGGDRLSFAVTLGTGVAAVATTQTAERAYAAGGQPARMSVELSLGAGAALDWLPQETILFENACLQRVSRVDMAGDAWLVWAEMLVLGRAAMGEQLRQAELKDRREIRRAGRLALCEPVRLDASVLQGWPGGRPALIGGARAFATVVAMAPGAEDALAPLRAALAAATDAAGPAAGAVAAASAWDGRCVARVAAADALPLRRAVAAALTVLRQGAPLPRVWQV